MYSRFEKIVPVLALLTFTFSSYAQIESKPNKPVISRAPTSPERSQREIVEGPISVEHKPAAQIEAELAKEYYKDCVQNLKWALGMMVALFAGFVGYAVFKSKGEYKDALVNVKDVLREAREACREAREASDKAGAYEQKAQERFANIDTEIAGKLKEIEEKGKESVADLIQEAERQRKISELWRKANHAYEAEDYKLAIDCYVQLLDEDPEDIESLINCGLALASQGEKEEGSTSDGFFERACRRFEQASRLRSDDDIIWSNWADALMTQSRKKSDEERIDFLHQAKEKCLKAEDIKVGAGAYNLACACSLLGQTEECKKWLKIGEAEGTLVTGQYATNDWCLENVRNEEWFKQIGWKDTR